MTKSRHTRPFGNLMMDMEASAKVSSNDLDKVYRDLAKKGLVPTRSPKTWQERNERIYSALGYIPGRRLIVDPVAAVG